MSGPSPRISVAASGSARSVVGCIAWSRLPDTSPRYQHDPQNPASLSDDSIWSIHIDRSGVLWVGTGGGGLDRFDPARGTFTHYRERDGLPSDRIVSILEDGDAADPAAGNLWIATGRGLAKLDRDRTTFYTYGTTDGLPLTEYTMVGTGPAMVSCC